MWLEHLCSLHVTMTTTNLLAPEAVQAAFNQQYGDATRVEWERERNGYLVAEFWKDNKEYDAWYTTEGTVGHDRS